MSDQDAIQVCITKYYQSLCTSDPDGVRSVFHPSARITEYLPDGLHEMTVEDFAGFVQSQQPCRPSPGSNPCWRFSRLRSLATPRPSVFASPILG